MKKANGLLPLLVAGAFMISNQSCKPKKILVNESGTIERTEEKPKVVEEAPKTVTATPVQQVKEEAPNYNFRNILFEFDSHVLKTDSYSNLDQIYREMRKDPNAKFVINGHASVEGTAEYNMTLSVDRANAVKIYLVNSGIPAENLTTKSFGATQPVASNDTESGRALNRRVEIKIVR
jgi:outer membrane protein OmpA-like peptidoglycan-associated protein